MNKRRLIFRTGAVLIVLAVAAAMFIIGRGHTVYLDNVTTEYNGTTYEAFHRVAVYVDGERVARLSPTDRGMTDTIMGQQFHMQLEITKEEDGEKQTSRVTLPLPYSMDGVIINVPALMGGAPADAYLSEFIQTAPAEPEEEEALPGEGEEIPGDEFEMQEDL